MNHPLQPLVEKTPEQRDAGERCSVASGSDVFAIQFLTSSGWQTDRELDSESIAIAHFFAVGKANVWTGHVRILHGERVVKSTLHPNHRIGHTEKRDTSLSN